MNKPEEYILDHERGLTQASPDFSFGVNSYPQKVLTVQETVNLSDYMPQRLRRSQVTYLKGKEDYMLYLNSCGRAIFHTWHGDRFTCALSKLGESSLKILSNEDSVYVILTRPEDGMLRFYRFEVEALRRGQCSRTKVLRNTEFSVNCLKQVDQSSLRVVIQTENSLEIWNLCQDSKEVSVLRQEFDDLWYSKGHLIRSSIYANGKLLEVINLDNGETKRMRIEGTGNISHAEILSPSLVLWGELMPIQVINLRNYERHFLPSPHVYIETELLNDSLIAFTDGTAQFVSLPHLPFLLKCRDPLFTDSSELLCVLSCNQLSILSKNAQVLSRSRISYRNVSSIGINEDTAEIYLGLKNGLVIVMN